MNPETLTERESSLKITCNEYLSGAISRAELADRIHALDPQLSSESSTLEMLPDIWHDRDHNVFWIASAINGAAETLQFRNFDFFDQNTATSTPHSILMRPHERYSPAFFHSHDYYEVVYVTSGCCLNLFPDATIELHANDVLFLPPGQVHALSVCRDDCIVYNFLIRTEALKKLLASLPTLQPFFSHLQHPDTPHHKGSSAILVQADPELSLRVRCLWQDYNALPTELQTSFLRCGFEQLLILLAGRQEHIPEVTTLQAPGATGEQLLNCIQAECATITLAELAWRFGYNYEHISRIIKKQTGSSFAHLRRRCRMEKAAGLLRDTTLPISQLLLFLKFP